MDNQQVTDTELGWLAGIIDGEGYLGMVAQNKRGGILTPKAEIQVVNTDPILVDRFVDILKRIGVSPYIREKFHNIKKNPKWKQAYNVTIGKQNHIVHLLTRVVDKLTGIKRRKAEIMLEFVVHRLTQGRKHYDDHSLSLYEKFRSATSETTCETPLRWVKI